MGGEKTSTFGWQPGNRGSPPRGRGKAYRAAGHCTRLGITPAWAGKSFSMTARGRVRKDHPRVGGEKCPLVSRFVFGWGSPPRGRGKVPVELPQLPPSRITPAWAGKRKSTETTKSDKKDHPRVGGEKHLHLPLAIPTPGSPPRGRGKDREHVQHEAAEGITPAWAGKRPSQALLIAHLKDHPRVGGEKLRKILSASLTQGSPPRGRGKVSDQRRQRGETGITPAWAGKRSAWSCRPAHTRDHPRVGGEKLAATDKATNAAGSPPRGRGKD